jgi:hypothetical protein
VAGICYFIGSNAVVGRFASSAPPGQGDGKTAPEAGPLRFRLARGYYIFWMSLAAAWLVGVAIVMLLAGSSQSPFLMLPFLAVAIFVGYAVASRYRVLSLDDPVLQIDQSGIFDKRATRVPIPWDNVRSVEPLGYNAVFPPASSRQWSGIKLEIDRKREHLAFCWFYFGLRKWGVVAWDDFVVDVTGLTDELGSSHSDRAEAIMARATNCLRASRNSSLPTRI